MPKTSGERVGALLERMAGRPGGRLMLEDMADVEKDTLFLLVQGDLATCHNGTRGRNYAMLTGRGVALAAQVTGEDVPDAPAGEAPSLVGGRGVARSRRTG